MAQDPGWRPARGLYARMLVLPLVGRGPKDIPVLVEMRTLVLVSLTHWAIFLSLLWTVELTPRPAAWQAVALLVAGTMNVRLVKILKRKPIPGDTARELAGNYRALFFLGWALANATPLWGFVLYFTTGRIWVYLLGLPFAFVVLAMIAPTTHSLVLRQAEIDASGRALSLAEALMLSPRELPSAAEMRRRRKGTARP